MFKPGDEAGWNAPTNFERHTRELQAEDGIRVVGVNVENEKIRAVVLEDDEEVRETVDQKALDWMYTVEEIEVKEGSMLLELEDDSEDLDF